MNRAWGQACLRPKFLVQRRNGNQGRECPVRSGARRPPGPSFHPLTRSPRPLLEVDNGLGPTQARRVGRQECSSAQLAEQGETVYSLMSGTSQTIRGIWLLASKVSKEVNVIRAGWWPRLREGQARRRRGCMILGAPLESTAPGLGIEP